RHRGAIRPVPAPARPASQRTAHTGRKHRRHCRPGDRAQGLSHLVGRQAGTGDQRTDGRPTLLHRLCPELARAPSRQRHPPPGALQSAQPIGVPRERRGTQYRRLVRGLRHQARRQVLPGAGQTCSRLVSPAIPKRIPSMKKVVLLTLALTAAACVAPTGTPAEKPEFGAWGIDLTSRDASVKPGDDFFLYANGIWLSKVEIPADRTSTGSF